MTVKESHNVAGLKTTWGFEWAKDYVASEDAVGVARLKAAGAVILGKTNVPVALGDWQTANPSYGRHSRNPMTWTRTPGGRRCWRRLLALLRPAWSRWTPAPTSAVRPACPPPTAASTATSPPPT